MKTVSAYLTLTAVNLVATIILVILVDWRWSLIAVSMQIATATLAAAAVIKQQMTISNLLYQQTQLIVSFLQQQGVEVVVGSKQRQQRQDGQHT